MLASRSAVLLGLAASQRLSLAQTFSLEPAFSVVDQVWRDVARNREIPVRLRIPAPRTANEKLPVIVYSPGIGGTRESGERWSEHWATNGYVVVNVQHHGSDVVLGRAGGDPLDVVRRSALATTPSQLFQRVADLRFVLDEIPRHRELAAAAMNRVGIAGHAFGAFTVQAMAGQNVSRHGPELADPRVRAVIALSPVVRNRVDAETQFGDVNVPFMSVTGTLDSETAGFRVQPDERVRPFYSMPAGGKYLVVFRHGDHAVFSGSAYSVGGPRPAEAVLAEPRIVRANQAITLAFWDAYLKRNLSAEAWLATQARGILAPDDRFERR
ncbi:acetylhydrolase [soil metagenome]